MALLMTCAMECPVCLNYISFKSRRETEQGAAIALCAGLPYEVCPACLQHVENPDDPDYRAAARQLLMEQAFEELLVLNPHLLKRESR
jgi:hypothetical protein